MNSDVLIIGAGQIAKQYVKAVTCLNIRITVVGRSVEPLERLKSEFPHISIASGGIEKWLRKEKDRCPVIVATQIENLFSITETLIDAGFKSILVEKPLTYNREMAQNLAEKAAINRANVYIAFNRRSYSSVEEAKRLIELDGGVSSFHFDFTEATFRIKPENYSKETMSKWGIANSSHVIDTAFYLCGFPAEIYSTVYGEAINWHENGSIFTGIGRTQKDVPFTYHSNWGCPGKWNIEIFTEKRKLFFSPMERLKQQKFGQFSIEEVDCDYSKDINFKPGFLNQAEKLLHNKTVGVNLLVYGDYIKVYNQIFKYDKHE